MQNNDPAQWLERAEQAWLAGEKGTDEAALVAIGLLMLRAERRNG
jgi:hypothetical protein